MAVQVLLYTADEFFLNQCKLLLSEDIRTFSVCSFSGAVRPRSPAYLFSVTSSRSWRRRRLSVTGVMPRNEAICLLLTESIIPG